MAVSPVLVIKTVDDSVVGVRARLYDDFVEHEIVLNSVLAYWWANNMPPALKFLELFESVIKRTINELMPHKNLKLKYEVKADDVLEKASEIEISLIEIEADGYSECVYHFEVPVMSEDTVRKTLDSTYTLKIKDLVIFKK